MTRAGVGDRFEQGILNAIAAARAAIQRAAERPISVAGSIGATPWGRPRSTPPPSCQKVTSSAPGTPDRQISCERAAST